MSLRWDWNNKIGTVEIKCTNGSYREANIYQGNALAIIIMEFDDDTYNLVSFFCDKEHFKNIIKNERNYFNDFKNWKISTSNKILIKLLVDNEIEVSTYKKIVETDKNPF